MTADEFRTALDMMGHTPASIAKTLGVDTRTARRWSTGSKPIPEGVAAQLDEIHRAGGITPKVAAEIRAMRDDPDEDTSRYLWVKRRNVDTQWTVAEHDVISNVYYLPGRTDRLYAEELILGDVIVAPRD